MKGNDLGKPTNIKRYNTVDSVAYNRCYPYHVPSSAQACLFPKIAATEYTSILPNSGKMPLSAETTVRVSTEGS